MAYAYTVYSAGSSQIDYTIAWPYIKEEHVKVYVNFVDTGFTFHNATTARLASAPASGTRVEVRRVTPPSAVLVDYADGSTLTASDLDTSNLQHLYIAQELDDNQKKGVSISTTTGLPTLGSKRLTEVADPTAAQDAATKNYVDTTRQPVDAELTELATMSSGTAAALADLTATEVQAIDGITSSTNELNILDGVTASTAELNYVDGVTSNVQTQLNAKQPLDAELTELATMASDTASSLADLTAAEVQTIDGITASTSELNTLDGVTASTAEINKLDGVTASTAELNIVDGVTSTTAELNILDGVTASTTEINYVDGVTSSVQTQLDAKQPLDSDLTALAAMQSGTASILAGGTALTATLTELNQIDGKTIGETTLTANSDTKIPTSKAVNDRILTVTNALGGFVAISNETSFPATHPDPSDGAGTVVSISDAGGVVVNGSGVATISNGAGSGNTVTINGFPSALQSKTLAAGIGLQVQTTTTLHTYDYHKVLAKEADVEQLSDDINDFKARYRTGTNNPTSDNDAGDLFYNTSTDKMLVRNSANNAWEEVQSIGNFYLQALSGFNGTLNDFTIANPPSNAHQIILSINGVIQKPNAGTSRPSEGFALDGSTLKLSDAPASGDTNFYIIMGSSVNIGTPSNNTVTEAILQNNIVSEEKLKASNNPTNGQFLSAQSGNTGGLTWATVTTSPTTTRGDIIYRGASADERLAKGNAGKYLKMGANDPEWADVGEANHIGLNDDTNLHFGTGDDALIRYYESGTGGWTGGVAGAQFNIETLSSSGTDTTPIRFFTSSVVSGNRIYTQYAAMSPTNKDVALFYNGTQKFITTNTGVTVAGTVAATAFTGDGSALTGISGGVSSDGAGNTHAGTDAGNSDNYSSALNNSCFGKNSGTAITEGDHNTLIGKDAGDAITTGSSNTALGTTALTTLSTGGTNTAIGKDALGLATTGSSNTAVGASALYATTTADENTAVGLNALQDNITGHSNVAIGSQALREQTTANYNTAVGKQAMQNTTGGENTAIGSVCMITNTTGTQNVAVGREAMNDNTTGGGNVAIGKSALANNTTGGSNVAVGRNALLTSTYRNSCVAVGEGALQLMTDGYSNVACGGYSLNACTTGYQNTALGEHAGRYITSGDYNTCIGRYGGAGITEGNNNIAVGSYALMATVTGNNNVCMGYEAGTAITSGAQNTCLGKEAGKSLTTGSHSICVGYRAGKDQMTTTGDQLYIANGSFSAGNDNCFIYGNSLGELIQGSNSSSWYTTSDSRLKKNIVDNNVGLSIIDNIKVRNFEYKTEAEIDRSEFPKVSTDKYTKEEADEGEGTEGDYKQGLALIHPGTQLGVIAQELESIAPNCVKTDHREVKTVSTDDLFWHMINAIKELSAKNTALEARLTTLEGS